MKLLKSLKFPGLEETFAPGVVTINGEYPDHKGNINLSSTSIPEKDPDNETENAKSIFVTPSMYGATHSALGNDSGALQQACNSKCHVIIDKDVYLYQPINVITSIEILSGVTVYLMSNTAGFKITHVSGSAPELAKAIYGKGLIKVNTANFTGSAITIDGGRYDRISDILIEGKAYNNPSGTGISIVSDSNTSAFVSIQNTSIGYFNRGIEIIATQNWNNNHFISTQTSFCHNSIYLEGGHKPNGDKTQACEFHQIKVFGQSGNPNNDNNNTEIQVKYASNNFFDIYLVDTGNVENNQYSIIFDEKSYRNIVQGGVNKNRIIGSYVAGPMYLDQELPNPIPGVYDVLANKDYTCTAVGNATIVVDKILDYPIPPHPSTTTGTRLQYECPGDEDGCRVTISGLQGLHILNIKSTWSEAPKKIQLRLKDNKGIYSEQKIINAYANYFNLERIFDYQTIQKCTDLEIEFIGARSSTERTVVIESISATPLQQPAQTDSGFTAYTKPEIDAKLGTIDQLLDAIIAKQEELLGGAT